jgi:hypothetical protein
MAADDSEINANIAITVMGLVIFLLIFIMEGAH